MKIMDLYIMMFIKEKSLHKVIIIDFESSLFDLEKQNINFLYKSYQQILNNISFELNIETNNMIDIMNYIELNIKLNRKADINILLNCIDKLTFNKKNDTDGNSTITVKIMPTPDPFEPCAIGHLLFNI